MLLARARVLCLIAPPRRYRQAVPLLFKCGERTQSERCKSLVVLADAREALRLAEAALAEQRFKVR